MRGVLSTKCCQTSTSTSTTPSAPDALGTHLHGKGTGALARAVRGMLASHPLVKNYGRPSRRGRRRRDLAHWRSKER